MIQNQIHAGLYLFDFNFSRLLLANILLSTSYNYGLIVLYQIWIYQS